MSGISRETFEGYDQDSKLNTLFDLINESHECSCRTEKSLINMKLKMEKKKVIDTVLSTFTGLGGGALAVLGLWFGGFLKK